MTSPTARPFIRPAVPASLLTPKFVAGWLAAGLAYQIVFHRSLHLLSPFTWLHVVAWPPFLLFSLMHLAMVAGLFLVAVAAAYFLVRYLVRERN
jgi:hypothetical protein